MDETISPGCDGRMTKAGSRINGSDGTISRQCQRQSVYVGKKDLRSTEPKLCNVYSVIICARGVRQLHMIPVCYESNQFIRIFNQ
jgi:hypothetical protein